MEAIVCQTGIGACAAEAAAAVLDRVFAWSRAVGRGRGGSGAGACGRETFVLWTACASCDAREQWHGVRAYSVTSNEALLAQARRRVGGCRLAVRVGSSLTVAEVVWVAGATSNALHRKRHEIVEMESYWVGESGCERGIPFINRACGVRSGRGSARAAGAIGRTDVRYDRSSEHVRGHPEQTEALARNAERWQVSSAALATVAAVLVKSAVLVGVPGSPSRTGAC